MRSKLSVRLALLFLVASLVPLVAATAVALELMRATLREDAQRRHTEVAQLCASVVEVWLDSTSNKLVALADLMRIDLLERDARPGDPVSDAELFSLQNRIAPLIDSNEARQISAVPALELEFFQNLNQAQAGVGPPAQAVVSGEQTDPAGYKGKLSVKNTNWRAQNSLPEVQRMVADRKLGRAESPLVQQPTQQGQAFCESVIEVIDGTPTLAMSVPVGGLGSNFGALVADIDFTELRAMLDQLAGDGVLIRVADEFDTPLFEMGSPSGEQLSRSEDIGELGWTVTVAEELSRIEAPLGPMRRQAGLWIAAASVLAVVLSFALSAGITRPVRQLQRAAEAMEGGDLSARSGLSAADEIGQLAVSFDRMAEALEHLDSAKSEFVGNVSHELRTPLTSMRLSVANLLDGVVGELDEKQRRTLGRVQKELDRMIGMVSELLEMARLEAGMVAPERRTVDLAQLAEECALARRPETAERGVEIEVRGVGEALADPAMLRRVIDNLLDNGLKFAPEASRVVIAVDGARLRVIDEGPGFEDGAGAVMFEKFRQGRPRGVKHDGVGLGLAIVARLVALMDGRVEIEQRPRAGLKTPDAPTATGASVLVELPEPRV